MAVRAPERVGHQIPAEQVTEPALLLHAALERLQGLEDCLTEMPAGEEAARRRHDGRMELIDIGRVLAGRLWTFTMQRRWAVPIRVDIWTHDGASGLWGRPVA
jgi:hypothetical protein